MECAEDGWVRYFRAGRTALRTKYLNKKDLKKIRQQASGHLEEEHSREERSQVSKPPAGKEFCFVSGTAPARRAILLEYNEQSGKGQIFHGVLDFLTPMHNMKLVQEPWSKKIV